MKFLFIYYFLIFSVSSAISQSEFTIENRKKVVIPFKLINNLIFIPMNVNGEELTFLLDTGVAETILFSLDDKEQIKFFNLESIKLRGLGSKDAINAFKSSKNTLEIRDFKDKNHEIYLVLDQEINFSSRVGIPVNGIIGYHFFKNHIVEINYQSKKIIIYNSYNKKLQRRLKRKYVEESISIEERKPYFISKIETNNKTENSKMLLDTGNSDAIWIFLNKTDKIVKPENTVQDFLGKGFSGDIFGLRGRISKFQFSNHTFENPIATFPDSTSIRSVNLVPNRIGSIGGEILSRFDIVFDYKRNKIYTKSNEKINNPFNINMSGIEVEHSGLEWVKESYEDNKFGGVVFGNSENTDRVQRNLQVRFILKPIFKIGNLRSNSEAEKVGLKTGDRLIKINKLNSHGYTIEKINSLLKSEEGKTIELEIERNDKIYNFKFKLKSLI